MKLEGEKGLLKIERCELGEPGSPSDGDVLLGLTAKVHGYSGSDQAWVVAGDFENFLAQLGKLETKRQGQAILEGASPEELRLEFFSTDSAGHMAVRGHLGWQNTERHFQQLRFGFNFEPDRLPYLVREFRKIANVGRFCA